MSDITLVNPQLLETMNSVRFAVNSPEVAVETGSNKAFNFVAQAAAMAALVVAIQYVSSTGVAPFIYTKF